MVTKSTGVGRGKGGGGAKPGAGRKRKLGAVEIEARFAEKPEVVIRKAARSGGKAEAVQIGEALGWAPDEVAEAIRPGSGAKVAPVADAGPEWFDARPAPTIDELDDLARKTLRQIMEKSPQDGPRVVAARHCMAVAADEKAKAGLGGKKGAQKARAEEAVSSGGKFAPPAAPGSRTFQ